VTDVKLDDADLAAELQRLLNDARRLVDDVDEDVEAILEATDTLPIDADEARALLGRVLVALRRTGDPAAVRTAESLEAGFDRVAAAAARGGAQGRAGVDGDGAGVAGVGDSGPPGPRRLELVGRDGVDPGPVRPTPTFGQRAVPMRGGFVRVRDLLLRGDNERLEVHLAQFRQVNGREPTADDLLSLLLSREPLPGLDDQEDEFGIEALGRSIANNGVRKPPVIDLDGTLLDGNRRVAACLWVLTTDGFGPEQRARAEWVYVWQLTDHSGQEDRDRVVVSLNFEPDLKKDWPEYVKARKVFDAWQEMLSLEPRTPGQPRAAELKRDLSERFALGPRTDVVNRYIKMVQWADQFEEHQVEQRRHDPYEVKHQAMKYFQYFDELSKGATRADGVATILGRDDVLRGVVFDLMFGDKFLSWRQVRDLRYVADNQEAIDGLRGARDERDLDVGQEKLKNVLAAARTLNAEVRDTNPNGRIEKFVEWLEHLPLSAFRDSVRPANLESLLSALKLVRGQAVEVLGEERVRELVGE